MVTVGERVRAARQRAVLGQAELARAAGISVNALWQIENGRRQPRPATLRKIATALEVSPLDLLVPASRDNERGDVT